MAENKQPETPLIELRDAEDLIARVRLLPQTPQLSGPVERNELDAIRDLRRVIADTKSTRTIYHTAS